MYNRTYLISFLGDHFSRDELIDWLDDQPEIGFWFYNLPNSVFITSHSLTAKQISIMIREEFGDARHVVSLVGNDYYGLLPKEHWDYFK